MEGRTMSYECVIGLEVHVELNTKSKIFCGCPTAFGAAPNTQVCPVCLGLPGALPVLNKEVVESALKAGLALNCAITEDGKQDRKNYFYPDLPKAYQISQSEKPIAYGGHLSIQTEEGAKLIGITRVHIEEDAGKLVHEVSGGTLIDYNRGGVPLIEIVSEPDMRSAAEAKAYLQKLRATMQFLGISSCKMNEGAFRCDVNLSVRKVGSEQLGTRTEMKNLNSFAYVVKAIESEMKRQIEVIEAGGQIKQETRRWDPAKGQSFAMRSKEDAHDYRYFPDPDLMPILLSKEKIADAKASLPKLPADYIHSFIDQDQLRVDLAEQLVKDKLIAEFYEKTAQMVTDKETLANLIIGELMKTVEETEEGLKVSEKEMAVLVDLLAEDKINLSIAKKVLSMIPDTEASVMAIIDRHDLWPITDVATLTQLADEIIAQMPQIVSDYKAGKTKALGAFIGQMMRKTSGKADPTICEAIFKEIVG